MAIFKNKPKFRVIPDKLRLKLDFKVDIGQIRKLLQNIRQRFNSAARSKSLNPAIVNLKGASLLVKMKCSKKPKRKKLQLVLFIYTVLKKWIN